MRISDWSSDVCSSDLGVALATISGRFYAMDRDKRWERVAQACEALVDAGGKTADSAEAAIEQAYVADETDEFVTPTAIAGYRSDGRRGGKECVRPCKTRVSPYTSQNKQNNKII